MSGERFVIHDPYVSQFGTDKPSGYNCPCCGDALSDTYDDAPFCWVCGLYMSDDPAGCDWPGHEEA